MTIAETAAVLVGQGRFLHAFDELSRVKTGTRDVADVLLVDVLERIGQREQALSLVSKLYRGKRLTDNQQSACELVLARIATDSGSFEGALQHLQKASALASRSGDLEQFCRCQMRVFALVSDRSGLETGAALFPTLRANVLKLGNPVLSAALHLAVGEVEGKRGLIQSSLHHGQVAERMLEGESDLWHKSWVENHLLAISIVTFDFDEALKHGERALALSGESGAIAAKRTCLSNLGNLFYVKGDLKKSVEYLEEAQKLSTSSGEHSTGTLESLARIMLLEDRLVDCDDILTRIEDSIQSHKDRSLHAYRHSLLTRASLQARRMQWKDALDNVNTALSLAAASKDSLLYSSSNLMKARFLAVLGEKRASADALLELGVHLSHQQPDIYAHYEGLIATLLAREGRKSQGETHYRRAVSIATALHNSVASEELTRAWNESSNAAEETPGEDPRAHNSSIDGDVLAELAAVLTNVSRSEIVASGIVQILSMTNCVASAIAETQDSNGARRVLCQYEDTRQSNQGLPIVTMQLPSHESTTTTIACRPRMSVLALATFNAARTLVEKIGDLQRMTLMAEERMTLWPLEDIPLEGDQTVVSGAMQGVMSKAQKVARPNVTVLITGESGTGKEIVARALHRLSPRADKPFIPFNCTAVPREMLESQLFGHRRGAFTGAERDHPGLIRAARDGTLFLDEVGELSLDLQPKLLRFLESGEINPLGEPSPFTVDVRILAATNANLEQLVQDGRFREDLYYRLNVIRIDVPPLRERRDEIPLLVHHFVAKAAREFAKGRIRVAEETMERLILYQWPGNIRQLDNELRRMIALAEPDSTLTPGALFEDIRRASARPSSTASNGEPDITLPLTEKLGSSVAKLEKEMIRHALHVSRGRVDLAARALGISRKGLYLKRQRLGL
jgi:DNA-binding NtrC family response regulator/tetratricopeptide (TPR) repeat protein